MFDIAIIGGGPAGLAAAINARRRNKETILIGKEESSFKLLQSHRIDNYPGMPEITGSELAEKMRDHAVILDTVFAKDEIQSIALNEDGYSLWGRENMWEAKSVILAVGIALGSEIAGEAEFTGRGVSYCATCDGMFFKGKPVAMIGYIPEAEAEARFLAEICSEVFYLPQYKNPGDLGQGITLIEGKPREIAGAGRVGRLTTTAGELTVDGVFIERSGKPLDQLAEGLVLKEGFIEVDDHQATNLPGIYAAGDCTGKPWQISRAVGQGQVAALSAVHYLEGLKK